MLRDRTSTQLLLAAIAAFIIGAAMIGYGLIGLTQDPPGQVQTLVDDGGGRGGGGSF